MKNNKSPGSDGYTTAFFNFFEGILNILLLELLIAYSIRGNVLLHKG
jgi:hypothetical protein